MNNIVERLTVLDYLIVVVYLIILIVIGYRASFSKGAKKDETLFLANKSLGWYSIGFNMWGTNVGHRCYLPVQVSATLQVS